jgi:L-amino acid N-acyltransferase
MKTRRAESGDLEMIREIMNDAILNTTSIYDYNTRSQEYVSSWFTKKEHDRMPVIVSELNGAVVGYGTYGMFRAWDAYQFSIEHSVYVHKDYRGKGIGSVLLQVIVEEARKNNYHTLIAGIDATNSVSIALHKKYGFVEVAFFKEVGYKFGKWLDLIFMQLLLSK